MAASQMTASQMTVYWFWTSQNLNSYFVDFEQIKKNICHLFAHAVHDNLQDSFT